MTDLCSIKEWWVLDESASAVATGVATETIDGVAFEVASWSGTKKVVRHCVTSQEGAISMRRRRTE